MLRWLRQTLVKFFHNGISFGMRLYQKWREFIECCTYAKVLISSFIPKLVSASSTVVSAS